MRVILEFFLVLLACVDATAACRSDVMDDVPHRVVGERTWVNGVALSIVELPSLSSADARAQFSDFWRRSGREVRTQTANGVEVTSRYEDGCLYALQVPLGDGSRLPARLVLSDLKRAAPRVPRSFDWPPAAEAVVLTDTYSEDDRRVARLLSYHVAKSPELASNQCLLRLTHDGWKIGVLSKVYGSNYAFNARKGDTSIDITVMKEASGAVVTMNFSEVAG